VEHRHILFIFQISAILLAAKSLGYVFRRWLKQPRVLGEIVAGMLIGPYALGMAPVPWIFEQGLFPHGISDELHALTLVGAVVLLFTAGLETNLETFLRYSGAGLATALGGAVVPFFAAAGLTVAWGKAESIFDASALAMGTVALATSVGLTVAVLSEMRSINRPEGATILAAAVIDDVIGLVVLAVVLALAGVSATQHPGGPAGTVFKVLAKAVLFWGVSMGVGLLAARYIRRFLRSFGGPGAMSILALALALFLAALAETVGLAVIIGAYVMGLTLSHLDIAHEIQRRMEPISEFLVPIFFCVAGMHVNFAKFGGVAVLALVFTVVAVLSKIVGCFLGAFPMGFNLRGALRIGVGMTPRQEVALIVAGMALTSGMIGAELYNVTVLMSVLTAVVTPPGLKWLFDARSGLWKERRGKERASARFRIELPGPQVADLVAERLAQAFVQEEFYVHLLEGGARVYKMQKNEIRVFMRQDDGALEFSAAPSDLQYARFVVLEEILALGDIFRDASRIVEEEDLRRTLLGVTSV
jgi:Kef-type K+ transport system membrane component KefB